MRPDDDDNDKDAVRARACRCICAKEHVALNAISVTDTHGVRHQRDRGQHFLPRARDPRLHQGWPCPSPPCLAPRRPGPSLSLPPALSSVL
eukprot:1159415-Rhodomonas_salina.1